MAAAGVKILFVLILFTLTAVPPPSSFIALSGQSECSIRGRQMSAHQLNSTLRAILKGSSRLAICDATSDLTTIADPDADTS